MNEQIDNISNRLSLHGPQRHSLEVLSRVADILPLNKEIDAETALKIINREFQSVVDFERSFPSICFALSKGISRTRLMGAFIAYLHVAKRIKNFFVLAPNLALCNRIIADFTPGTSDYVFKGVAEFSDRFPIVITSDNYNNVSSVHFDNQVSCKINIFNISKINSEVRGGRPLRINRISEYIGQSYFDFLAGLPDLVLLMDDSHHYRGGAGLRAINQLRPALGLEFTATPFVETNKGILPFKNIIYNYSLAQGMLDGYIKEIAVVTRKDFNFSSLQNDALETLKLNDGIAIHEKIKVELETYARQNNNKIVKPLLLVIARDVTHASSLMNKIQSDDFAKGYYKNKTIQIDSSVNEDSLIQQILQLERFEDPTEVIIHINMLKEGWEISRLFTIVPLRAVDARTLIEQSIGHGPGLPYGKLTGISSIDTLNIIAHDRFQEILDQSMAPNFPIRLKVITLDSHILFEERYTLVVNSNIENMLQLKKKEKGESINKMDEIFDSENISVAQLTYELIHKMASQVDLVPTTAHLQTPAIQQAIVNRILGKIILNKPELGFERVAQDINEIVLRTIKLYRSHTIDIPEIREIPKGFRTIFNSFRLQLDQFNFVNANNHLWSQEISLGESEDFNQINLSINRIDDLIVAKLADFDDVSYDDNSDVLYNLASQVVDYLNSIYYADETRKIVRYYQQKIADIIHDQMLRYSLEEKKGEYQIQIIKGYTKLRSSAYTISASVKPRALKSSLTDKNNTPKYLFNEFNHCLYPVQRFDSELERTIGVILDRESEKWFRPFSGQISIGYYFDNRAGKYEPDFIAETEKVICMIETTNKIASSIPYLKERSLAVIRWCKHISDFSTKNGGKPWIYVLIDNNEISENSVLADLITDFTVKL